MSDSCPTCYLFSNSVHSANRNVDVLRFNWGIDLCFLESASTS